MVLLALVAAEPHPLRLVMQSAHSDRVRTVARSERTGLLVSGSTDMRLWSKDGLLLRTWPYHANALAISGDGKLVLGVEGSTTVHLVRTSDGAVLQAVDVKPEKVINALAFTTDGRTMLLGGSDKVVRGRDVETGAVLFTLDSVQAMINRLAVSDDGRFIAAGTVSTDNEQVFVWDAKTKALKYKLSAHTGSVTGLAFSLDGHLLASSADDGGIAVWDMRTGEQQSKSLVKPAPKSVAFDRTGQTLASTDINGLVRLWNTSTGTERSSFAASKNSLSGAFFSSDNKYITSFGEDGLLRVSNASNGKLLTELGANNPEINRVVAHPQKPEIAVLTEDGFVSIWSLLDLSMVKRFRATKRVLTIAYSPNGGLLAVPGTKGTCTFYRTTDYAQVLTTEEMPDPVQHVLFHPGGEQVFFLHQKPYLEKRTHLLVKRDVRTGKQLGQAPIVSEPHGGLTGADISPDGNRLAVKVYGHDNVWVFATEQVQSQPIAVPFDSAILSAVFTDSSDRLLVVDTKAKLWSVDLTGVKTAIMPLAATYTVGRTLHRGTYISNAPEGGATLSLDAAGKWSAKPFTCADHHFTYPVLTSHRGFVACQGGSGLVTLVNLNTGARASLLQSKDDWLAFDTEGHFDGSRNSSRLMTFVTEQSSFGLEQMALQMNRPDLLLEHMGLGDPALHEVLRTQALKRQKRAGYNAAGAKPPTLQRIDVRAQGSTALIDAQATPEAGALRYQVYVNGVPTMGAQGQPVTAADGRFTAQLPLLPGVSQIEVSVSRAGVESLRAQTLLSIEAQDTKPRLFFYGFGVSKYARAALNLDYAAKDVRDVARALDASRGQYAEVTTRLWTDEQVLKGAFAEAAAEIKKTRIEDVVVVFVAGHGMYADDGTYYFVTHDTDPQRVAERGASFQMIEDLLTDIPARRKLLLLDTCESGERETAQVQLFAQIESTLKMKGRGLRTSGVSVHSGVSRNQRDRLLFADLTRRTGSIVLSSSKGNELSYESKALENGVFSSQIVRALAKREADSDKDGVVSIDELRTFVQEQVPQLTNDQQHPTVDRDNLYVRFGL